MQRLHTHRTKVRPQPCGSQAGFTLIELMVTVAVLSIISAVAFAGFRQNDYKTQYSRFVDDVEGLLITARDAAIDNSTRTQVSVESDSVVVQEFDQATNVWSVIARADIENGINRDLLKGGNTCVYGMTSGVQTPSQAQNVDPPTDCSSAAQVLEFNPDGSFEEPTFASVDNAGVTLWIADEKATATRISIIQLFPGGLIRKFEKTQ